MTAVTAKARSPSRAGMCRWEAAAFELPSAVRRGRDRSGGRSLVIVMSERGASQGRRARVAGMSCMSFAGLSNPQGTSGDG